MNDPSLALVLLTWNRSDVFIEAMETSLKNMGMDPDEIIWVDNGSTSGHYHDMKIFMSQFKNVTKIRNHKNFGMPRGFNQAFDSTRCDWILLSGPDVVFPEGWVKLFYDYATTIKDAGIVSMYNVQFEKVMERLMGREKELSIVDGLQAYKALPFDHFIFKRKILKELGYWREDFGLYAWSDVEWLHRVEAHMPRKMGLNSYVIPPELYTGAHHGKAGEHPFLGPDGNPMDYDKWRDSEINRPENVKLLNKCREEGWPYYAPF
jgi:GT2 family glycosyltransferase